MSEKIKINGISVDVFWDKDTCWMHFNGKTFSYSPSEISESLGDKTIKANIPGKVIKILGQVGQKVQKGETLALLEAMKMQYTLKAPSEGQLSQIFVQENEIVSKDQILMELI